MILIPVIDIAHGQVVHAVGGNRSSYPPLKSILCDTSHPFEVIEGLLRLHAFTHLYIADLDAITGMDDQSPLIRQLHARFPDLQLWIDPGIDSQSSYQRWLDYDLGRPVLGSETLTDSSILDTPPAPDTAILSLDFRTDRLLGPINLLKEPAIWPKRIICMCLDRVGQGRGPDLSRINQLKRYAPDSDLYAAGGVRDSADLRLLFNNEVAGVLLASALHNGVIGTNHLHGLG